jgi:SAM-dependent methyltransferase
VRVQRDFEALYRANEDPWSIGKATAPRYQKYFELVTPYASGSVLDIGAGSGAFLARFQGAAASLVGVDISSKAVEIGARRFPSIRFLTGAADRLDEVAELRAQKFDLILCSDVIYYLGHGGRRRLLDWISAHLTDNGVVLIAAWVPGGRYLSRNELDDLVTRSLVVEQREYLADSQHYACICRKRAINVALTIDYETWQPIPAGKAIDWQRDIFTPTDSLMALAKKLEVPLTFFVEVGEYFWLQDNIPEVAARMRDQWCRLAQAGHDLQLHLHPSWLPELGARREGDSWYWDASKAKIDDYPGDVTALIRRCKEALETPIRTVRPGYRVSVYRAGAYQAQPFSRLHAALVENGIFADSSVFPGAVSAERGYDYSLSHSPHQPYFASPMDPQLLAPPAEARMVEIPVFSHRAGRRAGLDGQDGAEFASHIRRFEERYAAALPPELQRLKRVLTRIAREMYYRTSPIRRGVNWLLPRGVANALANYENPSWKDDRYYVLLGHTKADLRLEDISAGIRSLNGVRGLRFVTMAHLASRAATKLSQAQRSISGERQYQVDRESSAVLGEQRNLGQSAILQAMIPLDRATILDFGCGAGYWSQRISRQLPWAKVVGVDAGFAFIEKATRSRGKNVHFCCADFLAMPFGPESFDCVYADNTLEHAYDVERTLAEVRRIMTDDGVLIAAIPSDARNPRMVCDNHTWKTHPEDAATRLERAGFSQVEIREIDTFRDLGMAPYPPSNDRLMLIKAWASAESGDPFKRAVRAMNWIYKHIAPTRSNLSQDAVEIIASGEAFCMGYAIALGQLLRREGYDCHWVTMEAEDHERGQGARRVDTHEIVLLRAGDRSILLDPTTNTVYPHAIDDLLRKPDLADRVVYSDDRGRARGYSLYNSSYWYKRVVRYAIRSTLSARDIRWLRSPHRDAHG